MPVESGPEFDAALLQSDLRDNIDGFGDITAIERVRGGQSNPTYFLSTTNHDYVLRKKPPGKLLPTAHAIEREFRVMRALADTGVPVPRVRYLCEDPSIVGTSFYVMDRVDGRTLRKPLLPDMSPAERQAIYDSMNEVLARLHTVDWKAVGLQDYGKTENYFQRQLHRWTKQYEASKNEEVSAMDKLIGWLAKNIPNEDSTSIVHGDFRLENLLVHEQEPRVVATLDWELSTLGHPMADVAFNCMPYYLPSDAPVAPGFVGTEIQPLGIPSEEEYVDAYCRRTGFDIEGNWTFYVAFSLFRVAAIQQGIYARALGGNANSDEAIVFGDLYKLVAEQGRQRIEAAR